MISQPDGDYELKRKEPLVLVAWHHLALPSLLLHPTPPRQGLSQPTLADTQFMSSYNSSSQA